MVIMIAETVKTPLQKMRDSFPRLREKANGWWEHDDSPTFDALETPEGNIIINSWTGYGTEQILAMGTPQLKMADLFAKSGTWSKHQSRAKLTLLDLAWYMRLHHRYLAQLGYEDGYVYSNKEGRKTSCVKIGGYCSPDGSPHTKNRVRISLTDKLRFLWDQGTPGDPIPCGLHRLGEARQQGYLFIGEGESDAATMWFHKQPFLGLPGASSYKFLDVAQLADIPRVYIVEEPDQAQKNSASGKGFYADVRLHLRAGGYTGEIFSIRWHAATGYKDPSAMHKYLFDANIDMLTASFQAMIEQAILKAIPEGNETIEHQEDIPDSENMQAAFPALNEGPEGMRDLLRWIMGVCAVPASHMSPAQKIVLLVIVLHAQMWSQAAGEWWKVEADTLSEQAGMAKETFLGHLSYMTKKMPLFEKKHEKEWYTPASTGGAVEPACRTHLFIQPSTENRLDLPTAYRLAENVPERKHGGVQQPKPKCVNCGSENIDEYKLHHCRDCDYKHYPPEAMVSHYADVVESEPPAPTQEDTQNRQLAPYSGTSDNVTSSEEPEPIQDEATSEIGNLPPINKENTSMIGKLPFVEASPVYEGPKNAREAARYLQQWVTSPVGYGQIVFMDDMRVDIDVMGRVHQLTGEQIAQIRT